MKKYIPQKPIYSYFSSLTNGEHYNQFTERLEEDGVKISMDGKGRALDNVFVERLWRSVKYEDIYPKGYESLKEVRQGLKKYFDFYNEKRPHQGLKYRTPADVYFEK